MTRPLSLGVTPKFTSWDLLLALRSFVNTVPDCFVLSTQQFLPSCKDKLEVLEQEIAKASGRDIAGFETYLNHNKLQLRRHLGPYSQSILSYR